MKWLIDMPEGWKPGDCYVCRLKCKEAAPNINPACPLSHAVKAVEVKAGDIDRVAPDNILAFGKPVRIFAVEEKE